MSKIKYKEKIVKYSIGQYVIVLHVLALKEIGFTTNTRVSGIAWTAIIPLKPGKPTLKTDH